MAAANTGASTSTSAGTVNNPSRLNSGNGTDEFVKYKPLVQAINRGDLKAVKEFIERMPDSKTAILDTLGNRFLHLAISCGQVKIVEELIQKLNPQELELTSHSLTSLNSAAMFSNIRIVKCIINRVNNNKNIFGIASNDGHIPVVYASCAGDTELTRYLYSLTPPELFDGPSGSSLLCTTIRLKLFGEIEQMK
ncbi:hypothetical protein ACFE04_002932 [Oxalis oulophora]